MADIYKVSVGIALSSNYAEVLGAMAGQLRGIDGQIQGLIGKWNSLGDSMKKTVTGLGQVAGGLALGAVVAKITEAGGELVKFQGQLQNLGKSAADIRADTDAAMQAQIMVHGTNAAENLKVLRELSGVTANSDDARSILQKVLKDASVVSSLMGGSPTDSIQTLVKAAELRGDGIDPRTGKIDPDRLAGAVHQEVATLVAGGGLIKPGDLLQLVQQAGPAARMYADAATFWQNMTTPLMDMGGRRAGTADTALARQLFGGKMSMATADQMAQDHLLNSGMYRKSGTGVVIDDGAVVGEDILKGPGGLRSWIQSVVLPGFAKEGITSPDAVQQEFYKVFGTETARRMAALYATSQAQIEKDASLQRAAAGQDLYGNMMGTDLGANTAGLSSALGGLMQVLGAPIVKPAIAGINALTSGLNSLMSVFAAHPDAAGTSMGAVAAGGATLFGLGAKNIYSGLFGGGGLTGSATALNTSASLLNQAAYALGAKGGAAGLTGAGSGAAHEAADLIGGGSRLKRMLNLIPFLPDLLFVGGEVWNADSSWRAAHPYGDTPTSIGHGAIYGGAGRKRNPFAVGQPGVPTTGYETNGQRQEASGIEGFREALRSALGRDPKNFEKPLDLSQAKLPPVQTTVDIKPAPVMLDGRVIGQLIQSAIVKAGSIINGTAGFDGTAQPRPAGQ